MLRIVADGARPGPEDAEGEPDASQELAAREEKALDGRQSVGVSEAGVGAACGRGDGGGREARAGGWEEMGRPRGRGGGGTCQEGLGGGRDGGNIGGV
jgi:hypothetical protein